MKNSATVTASMAEVAGVTPEELTSKLHLDDSAVMKVWRQHDKTIAYGAAGTLVAGAAAFFITRAIRNRV